LQGYSRMPVIENAFLQRVGLFPFPNPEAGAAQSARSPPVGWRWELYRQHQIRSPKTFLPSDVLPDATIRLMGLLPHVHLFTAGATKMQDPNSTDTGIP